VIVNPSANTASHLFNNCKASEPHREHSSVNQTADRVADTTIPNAVTGTSSHTQSTSIRLDGVERDISVILLKCAQIPKSSASEPADASVTEPHDVSRLVLSMLQKQNIKPVFSVARDENEQQEKRCRGSSCAAGSEAKLKKMLQTSDREKAVLARKLKAEQAKVRYLLAEVNSLNDTLTQLNAQLAAVLQ